MPVRPVTADLAAPLQEQGIWRDSLLYQLVDAHAERAPEALAVADQHERLSYAELVVRSSAFARWLNAQQLAPGSVVATQTGNRVALAITHLACSRADLTFLPLSTQWRRTELENLLRRSGVCVLVLPQPYKDIDFLKMVDSMRDDLPRASPCRRQRRPDSRLRLRRSDPRARRDRHGRPGPQSAPVHHRNLWHHLATAHVAVDRQ